MKALNLKGQKFGRLTAQSPTTHLGKRAWHCLCDCGREHVVLTKHLTNGSVLSCGCYRFEVIQANIKNNITHGMSHSRLTVIYNGMKGRCYNPSVRSYRWYGARGIKICPEWHGHIDVFIQWALSNGYADNLQIDRKNNDKDYSPDNCQWSTPQEQQKNRRISPKKSTKGMPCPY